MTQRLRRWVRSRWAKRSCETCKEWSPAEHEAFAVVYGEGGHLCIVTTKAYGREERKHYAPSVSALEAEDWVLSTNRTNNGDVVEAEPTTPASTECDKCVEHLESVIASKEALQKQLQQAELRELEAAESARHAHAQLVEEGEKRQQAEVALAEARRAVPDRLPAALSCIEHLQERAEKAETELAEERRQHAITRTTMVEYVVEYVKVYDQEEPLVVWYCRTCRYVWEPDTPPLRQTCPCCYSVIKRGIVVPYDEKRLE